MLWNGAFDEFTAADQAFSVVLGPFVEMLRAHDESTPPRQPTNPAPSAFEGSFNSAAIPGLAGNATISIYNETLLMRVNALSINIYLRVPESSSSDPATTNTARTTVLQMWAPRDTVPCMDNELAALINSFVVFNEDLSSFSIPGYLPGYSWTRVQER